jgi:hypothetical protein
MRSPAAGSRDRDPTGRARNARVRDKLGRPLERATNGEASLDEPALPPADALVHAQALLDDGRPFTAHEVLEAVWKATSGQDRQLWRGLAQLAVGITHSLRGNDSGARSLLLRSAATLESFGGTSPYDVDVDGIREWAIRASEDHATAARPPRLLAIGPPGSG